MLFGCNLMIFLTYVPLNFLYELIVPPKETKKMELDPEDMEGEELTPEEAAQQKADAIEKGEGAVDLENENADLGSNASLGKSGK